MDFFLTAKSLRNVGPVLWWAYPIWIYKDISWTLTHSLPVFNFFFFIFSSDKSSIMMRSAISKARQLSALKATARRSVVTVSGADNENKIPLSAADGWSSKLSSSGYHVSPSSSMLGVVYWDNNKPFSFEKLQMPRPKAGEVLIKTKGMRYGRW